MSISPVVVLDAESMKYPRHLLDECESGLLLFCSGRMGAADGHWFRESGIPAVTCVDWDEKTLEPFRKAYPSEWMYIQADAFHWAKHSHARFDVVSVDAPSQYGYRTATAETLGLWCRLSRRYVTATVMTDNVEVPDGWTQLDLIERYAYDDGRAYRWLVLERA